MVDTLLEIITNNIDVHSVTNSIDEFLEYVSFILWLHSVGRVGSK